MFGIGGTELIVIAIVLLIAVGPNKLPNLLKALVKGYREFRRATRELRASTGIDEILQDEDLRELRKPIHIPPAKPATKAVVPAAPRAAARRPGKQILGYTERTREAPPEGVDVAEARDAMHRPSPEEADRIRARKQAIVDAKIAAAGAEALDDEERQRIVDAKIAAAQQEPPDQADRERIVDAKIAAAQQLDALDDAEGRRVVDAENAARDGEEERRALEAKIAAARADLEQRRAVVRAASGDRDPAED
jgi:Tat protein translocase TatB subunit